MDKKFRDTANLCVEVMTAQWETRSRGTNSHLPFDVNAILKLSINAQETRTLSVNPQRFLLCCSEQVTRHTFVNSLCIPLLLVRYTGGILQYCFIFYPRYNRGRGTLCLTPQSCHVSRHCYLLHRLQKLRRICVTKR